MTAWELEDVDAVRGRLQRIKVTTYAAFLQQRFEFHILSCQECAWIEGRKSWCLAGSALLGRLSGWIQAADELHEEGP